MDYLRITVLNIENTVHSVSECRRVCYDAISSGLVYLTDRHQGGVALDR